MTLALPPDVFQVSYEPSDDILAADWPRPLPMELLPACYEKMLAAAQAQHNCRFWLLDIRQRNWHSAEFGYWFLAEFVQRAVAALGQPLFMAYLVADEQQQFIESGPTDTMLRQAARLNCFPFYFSYEEAALAWLRDQRAAEQASLPGQPRAAVAAQ
ncbi:hypothetical protein E4631_06260 [Hymenobacter sp. UV11]|uniref:hypothetical protein n=1 Tax=Hymenobacter sp. UV11 TaxID=1849735 RepID=UPI00105E5068|nr:hypothetical protein [Hymenobacter sp. UV11]TDN38244.1 hypothetical protein A8B98_24875 [Hymenobacter sp. UV11]TFZ67579.1 hypothetical protein E4631_06260 [Hymenobacter sp. UV11]